MSEIVDKLRSVHPMASDYALCHEAANKISELEQQLDKLTQSDIDKIMAMSDEQITALTVMDGHNPEDIASLGKKIAEIALLKQQLADLQNKKAVLLSNDQIGECYSVHSWYEFARVIERYALENNGIKVGE